MTGLPWSKFYWSDWRSDAKLHLCSLAARALWMEMLCIAAEHNPTGYVAVNGQALGVTDIAKMAGATETECEPLLAELDRNGVFSRSKNGMIYCRRMIRDAKKSKIARQNGKNGGNPSLRKERRNSASDNQKVKPPLKPQKPEASSKEEADGVRLKLVLSPEAEAINRTMPGRSVR